MLACKPPQTCQCSEHPIDIDCYARRTGHVQSPLKLETSLTHFGDTNCCACRLTGWAGVCYRLLSTGGIFAEVPRVMIQQGKDTLLSILLNTTIVYVG